MKPLQQQPFAAFEITAPSDEHPDGKISDVRRENWKAKIMRKPRNWKICAVIRYDDGDVIREDVVDFDAHRVMPTDFTSVMYRELNRRIAGRKWYFARVTCRPILN